MSGEPQGSQRRLILRVRKILIQALNNMMRAPTNSAYANTSGLEFWDRNIDAEYDNISGYPLEGLGPNSVYNFTVANTEIIDNTIRIDDPGHILSQYERKVPGAHLLIGLGNDVHAFMPAPIVSQPFNSVVKLEVFSTQFQLSSAGIPLAKTPTAIPIAVPTGQQPATLVLQVTGRSAQ